MRVTYPLSIKVETIFGSGVTRDILGKLRVIPSKGFSGPVFTQYPSTLDPNKDPDKLSTETEDEFKAKFRRIIALKDQDLLRSDVDANGILTLNVIPSIQYVVESSYELSFDATSFVFQMPTNAADLADIMRETVQANTRSFNIREALAAEVLARKALKGEIDIFLTDTANVYIFFTQNNTDALTSIPMVGRIYGRVRENTPFVLPPTRDDVYVNIVQAVSNRDFTDIVIDGFSQLNAFTKSTNTFTVSGTEYEYWVSNRLLSANDVSGSLLTLFNNTR